jgi:epoxyqueuosine reductase
MSLEEDVKERALDFGADFVGIASKSRFAAAPEWSRPENLLPDFQSVISFGIAMDRGPLEAFVGKRTRRPLGLSSERAFDILNSLQYDLSHWLERQGHKSLFVLQNLNYNLYSGRPEFSHMHAAVAAGLGRLGMASFFVSNEFGGAVHLTSIITEAELVPDPMVSDEDDPCNQCKLCIEVCPVQAISRERTKSFLMEGKEYKQQWVDKIACGWGCSGLAGHRYQIGKHTVGSWAYNDLPIPTRENVSAAYVDANRLQRHPMELAEVEITGGSTFCAYCNKVCVGSKKDNAAFSNSISTQG